MDFCTLFDSKYIDRGLVMYESLMDSCDEAVLYVIAFDDECAKVLKDLNLRNMVVIPYDEFEDDTLRQAKGNRSAREFFWTCSGYSIRYIIRRFDLPYCTYIDSDLYFYNSPESAVKGFLESEDDVAIISHRYSDHPENNYNAEMYGKYCVEFNSFKNNSNGMGLLDWWISKCLECCTEIAQKGLFGDQKYIDQFTDIFGGTYIYDDFGLGVAPWNIDDFVKKGDLIENRHTHESGRIVFYHYHSLDIYPDGGSNIRVFIRPGRHDRKLVESLYRPYIEKIIRKRRFLFDKYGLFNPVEAEEFEKVHEGELKMFLTCEPSIFFLIRKIFRYMLHKNKDYIRVDVSAE